MALRLAAALALVALVAGCGGGKPHFERAAGWRLLARGDTLVASNVPLAPADRSLAGPPSHTVGSLPRYGVLLWLLVGRHHNGIGWDRKFPPVPLRVDRTVATNPPEGFSCPPAARSDCFAAGGAIRRLQARAAGWDVAVTIFFGSDRPQPEDVAAADAELARLRLPGARLRASLRPARCPAPTGTGYYDSTVHPSSGPPGSTATLSGRLPGRAATEVVAFWNLDFDHWPSIVSSSPLAAVRGSPVKLVGTQYVAGRCTYRVRVEIPSAPPGTYPLEALYGDRRGGASFAPVEFRVTSS